MCDPRRCGDQRTFAQRPQLGVAAQGFMLLRSLFRRVVVGGEFPWLRICEVCKIPAPCRASHRARDCACMSRALVQGARDSCNNKSGKSTRKAGGGAIGKHGQAHDLRFGTCALKLCPSLMQVVLPREVGSMAGSVAMLQARDWGGMCLLERAG